MNDAHIKYPSASKERSKESGRYSANQPAQAAITLIALGAGLGLISCGSENDLTGADLGSTHEETGLNAPSPTEAGARFGNSGQLSFEGYVMSAFEVTVDGEEYSDLEDFYTQELARLPLKVQEAGYSDAYEINFEAQIGIRDLWQEMMVYISSVEDRGYLGTARVGPSGDFSIPLPDDANETTYKVRAIKRITLRLSNGESTQNFCYNFSAIDKNVLLSDKEKPIILDAFETRITSYACSNDGNTGVSVPQNTIQAGLGTPAQPASPNPAFQTSDLTARERIVPGDSKEKVLSIIGEGNFSIVEGNEWCIVSSARDLCAINYARACRCSITFNEDDLAIEQDNMSTSVIETLAW